MLPKENEYENVHSPLDTDIHTSFVSNSLKVETTQRAITVRTDGQGVLQLYKSRHIWQHTQLS